VISAIVPKERPFGLGMIIVRAFVDQVRDFGGNTKTMGQARRNIELVTVDFTQTHADPLAERRGTPPQVDGHIEDFAADHPQQFSLGMFALVV
jgi:hypothetical protein